MHQPQGFIDSNPLMVCKLSKAIYGLSRGHKPGMKSYIMHSFNLALSQVDVITLYLCIIITMSHSMHWSI